MSEGKIADEMRAAAKTIREALENPCRCWPDNLFTPVVADLVARTLDEEADDMDRTARESIYGENAVRFAYEAGVVAPILLLARAINAEPSQLLSVEGKDTKVVDHG